MFKCISLPQPARNCFVASLSSLFCWVGVQGTNANAETAPSMPQVVVGYKDLDLTTQQGARQACHALEGRDLSLVAKWQACYDQGLSVAITKINLDALTALHSKTPGKQRLAVATRQP